MNVMIEPIPKFTDCGRALRARIVVYNVYQSKTSIYLKEFTSDEILNII